MSEVNEDKNFEKQARRAIGRIVMTMDDKRGVLAGRLMAVDGRVCTLEGARMCVHWTSDEAGVIGLATHGPGPGCRITHAAEEQIVTGVHSMVTVTDEAWARWEERPWSS